MTIDSLLAGLIVVIILSMIVLPHHPMFKMTSQTVGTVASATEREVRDEVERRGATRR